MANGHSHKKIKTQRKAKRARLERQYELRAAASHIQTRAFLACNELLLYHFLETLHRIRLLKVVERFIGHENVKAFFLVLEQTDSAIGGSTLPRVLAPPVDDIDDWLPSNLNLFVPLGRTAAWDDFFRGILLLPCADQIQPGIARPYRTVTNSHVEYESRIVDHYIMLSESIDECVITPVTAASTTLGMSIATCSTTYILYPELTSKRRALEAWNPPNIRSCLAMEMRGYRRSITNMSWSKTCGWNCPFVWRRTQGLRGVGVFCWGGFANQMVDNGVIGVPFTDVAMKWRLGDTCSNVHCPWSAATS
ncbi:hypothetical protein DFH09DRAFT_1085488 [Mycena vulgaris]|nr:hypothetical protein DFH09DRAFT_1085488 [Mycena vulgaris]